MRPVFAAAALAAEASAEDERSSIAAGSSILAAVGGVVVAWGMTAVAYKILKRKQAKQRAQANTKKTAAAAPATAATPPPKSPLSDYRSPALDSKKQGSPRALTAVAAPPSQETRATFGPTSAAPRHLRVQPSQRIPSNPIVLAAVAARTPVTVNPILQHARATPDLPTSLHVYRQRRLAKE